MGGCRPQKWIPFMLRTRASRPLVRLARGAACAALLGFTATAADAAGFQVELNHSKALHLPTPVATVMVSNPAIADVSVQGPQLLYVLARSYGRTDMIALDANGKQIAQYDIDVVAERNASVTLMRGTMQTTYSCTPRCEPVVNPSDSKTSFDAALNQAASASAMGSGAAMAAAAAANSGGRSE